MYKPEDVAYLAGLFEAEGNFYERHFYWRNGEKRLYKTPQPRIRINMTNVEPLQRLRATFGGRLYGPYKNGKECYKPIFNWNVASLPEVRELIELMWGWLSPRRQRQFGVYHTVCLHEDSDMWRRSGPGPEHMAYLAGLFEGDGTFCVQRSYWYKREKRIYKTPQPLIRIQMTDEEPLERLQTTFGGRLYGPYRSGKECWKPYYAWSVASPPKVRELIDLIWPWLSSYRQEQVGKYYVPV